MAWYNKYRPVRFEQVIGQELITEVLEKTVQNKSFKHAYLFSGPKGTGKTTLARIFANQINNTLVNTESKFDIIEMDAASNTGIDDIRSLIESSKNPPISGEYKIYIIDEVHMLSKNAMNALLKILEEPPSYLIFLLATTNPEKLIPTILSRVTKLNLSSHSIKDIVENLKSISKSEKIEIEEKALEIIAKRAEGGQRDAINLLETISGFNIDNYDVDKVSEILGLAKSDFIIEILDNCKTNENDKPFIEKISNCGIDGKSLLNQVLTFALDQALFENNFEYDELINPIAEVISVDLPINDAITAFALLQSKLRNIGLSSKKKLKLNDKTEPTQVEIKETIQEQIKTKLPEKQTEQVVQSEKPIPNNTNLDLETINHCFKEISKNNNTPITLKLLSLDVVTENISIENDDSIIEISVSNGVYLAQINSEKNKLAFEKILMTDYNINCKIKAIQRKGKTEMKIETNYGNIMPSEVEFVGRKPENQIAKENEENKSSELNKNEVKAAEKIADSDNATSVSNDNLFYKIYHNKAKNMENINVEIFEGKIPRPSAQISNSPSEKEEWKKHINGFDFE